MSIIFSLIYITAKLLIAFQMIEIWFLFAILSIIALLFHYSVLSQMVGTQLYGGNPFELSHKLERIHWRVMISTGALAILPLCFPLKGIPIYVPNMIILAAEIVIRRNGHFFDPMTIIRDLESHKKRETISAAACAWSIAYSALQFFIGLKFAQPSSLP